MIIETVRLSQFRNYDRLSHNFVPGLNFFFGNNGEGKTNLLESIYYLSHFSSFRTHQTEILSRNRGKKFSIQASFKERGKSHSLTAIQKNHKKEISFDGKIFQKQWDIQGRFKVLLFTVRDIDLVLLGPAFRREFIDQTLTLMKSEYGRLLADYEKLLKLRNQQLKQGKHQKKNDALIISYGTKIIYARNSFLKAILPNFQKVFSQFTEAKIPIDICYRLGNGMKSDIIHPSQFKINEDYYGRWLEEKKKEDQRRGFTHFGPHADDYLFQIRNELCKNNASQGEMRLFIYTLKLAIYEYLKKVIQKTPVILLDDVFNDFDEKRTLKFFDYLAFQKQAIITCANRNLILPYLKVNGIKETSFRVHQGKIDRIS